MRPKNFRQKGMTVFIAVVIMSILLFISFAVVNITIKSTLFASSGRDSQLAFYAADAGLECALYWDGQDPSPFDTGVRSTFAELYVSEFSGLDQSSPIDRGSDKVGNTAPREDVGEEIVTSNNVTTSFANELLYGFFVEQGGGPAKENTSEGFIPISHLWDNLIEYKVVSTQGTYHTSAIYTKENTMDPKVAYGYFAQILTLKAAAGQTPAFVQEKSQHIEMPTPVQVTLDNNSTAHNLMVVSVTYNKDTYDINTIDDDNDNKYTKALGATAVPDQPWTNETWYAKNINASANPITVTVHSSAFTPIGMNCNGQSFNAGLGPDSNQIKTNPPQAYRIGGTAAQDNDNTSIFQLDFSNGTCAIVTVTKDSGTTIKSKGYNTCNASHPRRVERGIEVTY